MRSQEERLTNKKKMKMTRRKNPEIVIFIFQVSQLVCWPSFLLPGTPTLAGEEERTPGRYQRLDLFIIVLRVLCPNLTDDSFLLPG